MFVEKADHLFVDKYFKNFTKALQKTSSGMMLALLKLSGKADELIHELYNIDSGCIKTLLHTPITLELILSGPLALLTFSFSISSRTSDSKIGAKQNELLILFFQVLSKISILMANISIQITTYITEEIIKSICYRMVLNYFSPSTCKEDILHLRFLLLLSIGPKCFHKFVLQNYSCHSEFVDNKTLLHV